MNKKVQKVGKSKARFLIQKNYQFIFAALFKLLMSKIFHTKKLDDFSAANTTKITTNVKKGEELKTGSLSKDLL